MNGADELFDFSAKLEPDKDYSTVVHELHGFLERGARFAWITLERGDRSLAALIHRPVGWLQFYEDNCASSAHSLNPDFSGYDAFTDYLLSNGQVDVYPTAFAYPLETVLRALEHFLQTGARAPFIVWDED